MSAMKAAPHTSQTPSGAISWRQRHAADSLTERSVREMLAASDLSHHGYVEVTARKGAVILAGTVSDGASLADFKRDIAASHPGVPIEDHLEWVVPDCGIGCA